jgi:hypothetical protein
VLAAPAVVRRDGTVLAGAWLPDLVRLGELERHLDDGVTEAAADAAAGAGRLRPPQRRRIMSCPLVIQLMPGHRTGGNRSNITDVWLEYQKCGVRKRLPRKQGRWP